MGKRLTIGLVLFAAASVVHAQAPASPNATKNQIEAFLAQLQRAAQAGDRAAIAAMVRYPITVSIGGLRVPFADAAAFLERYEDIFNPALRDAIARASVSEAGIIGTNEVVISDVNGQLRITAITVPQFDGGNSSPAAAAAGGSTGNARKPGPRRVAIRVGPRPTQIAGSLAPDGTDVYVLFLPKGRLAGIRLERVPAGSAVIRVVHARTGAPLAARMSADGRFVSGRPPEGADYRIEVQGTGAADDGHLPYMLSLTLR